MTHRTMPDGSEVVWRDRLAWWLASQALRIATPLYRSWLTLMIRAGRKEIDQRLMEGRSVR